MWNILFWLLVCVFLVLWSGHLADWFPSAGPDTLFVLVAAGSGLAVIGLLRIVRSLN